MNKIKRQITGTILVAANNRKQPTGDRQSCQQQKITATGFIGEWKWSPFPVIRSLLLIASAAYFFQNQKEANHNLFHSLHRLILPAKTQPIAAWRCLARIFFCYVCKKKVFSRKLLHQQAASSKQQVISIAWSSRQCLSPLCFGGTSCASCDSSQHEMK